MRIATSPTLRIAAGLLLAALPSIVGYRVFRRWISRGPEARLKRADDLLWLVSSVKAQSTYSPAGLVLIKPHLRSMAAHVQMDTMHGRVAIRESIPNAILDSIVVNLCPDIVLRMSVMSRRQAHFAMTK